MIDDEIAENFLRLVADSATNGVPEMHFRLWRRTTEAVRDQHLAQFRADPAAVNWFETGYLAEDPDFDALIKLAKNTLGYLYARHIIDNNLRRTIASDYRRAHERLQAEGQLEGMPDEVR